MAINKRHGYYYHPLYHVWADMKSRCYNKNNSRFNDWGGRGITVCDEWFNYPTQFISWALMSGWKQGLVLDRIDNNGNYEPNNCRFVEIIDSLHNRKLIQNNNKSGYRGVSLEKSCNKWKAQIRINSKKIHLGLFDDPMYAALEYDYHVYLQNDGRPMNFIQR